MENEVFAGESNIALGGRGEGKGGRDYTTCAPQDRSQAKVRSLRTKSGPSFV